MAKEAGSMGFVACDKLTRYDEFRENEVTQILKRLLEDAGCTIIYESNYESRRQEGPDVVAYCGDSLLIIEARGVPTKFKVKGKDRGKPKSERTINNQFRHYSEEVIAELMEREYEWNIEPANRVEKANWVEKVLNEISQKISAQKISTKYIAVFGYHEKYTKVLDKRKLALERLGYEVWLIDKEGKICKYLAT
jgi:Holliday junction resolvase